MVQTSTRTLPTTELLSFPLCTATRAEVLEWLLERLTARTPTHVVTLNPEMVLLDKRAEQGLPELHAADLYVADGVGIVWAAKRLLGVEVERYPGVDMAHDLLLAVADRNGRAFLLGGAPGVAEQAAANLTTSLPGLRIAGTKDGFFAPVGDAEVARRISASEVDVLLVGMGCPRQEGFITMHRETLAVPVMVGVGGTLDVFAGIKRRAPRWVQRCGMEWAWRGLGDPARARRIGTLPQFASLVLKQPRRRA